MKSDNKYWITRNKDGKLLFHSDKPIKYDNEFRNLLGQFSKLNRDEFPEVTWENSPVEVELRIKKG